MLGFWETGRALTAPRAAEQVSSSLPTCVSPVPDLQGRDTVVTCKTLVSAGPNIRTETRKKQSSAYCNRELLPHLQHIFNTACCVLLHCFFLMRTHGMRTGQQKVWQSWHLSAHSSSTKSCTMLSSPTRARIGQHPWSHRITSEPFPSFATALSGKRRNRNECFSLKIPRKLLV